MQSPAGDVLVTATCTSAGSGRSPNLHYAAGHCMCHKRPVLLRHVSHAARTARKQQECAQGQVPARTFSAAFWVASFSSWPARFSLSAVLAMQWVPGKAAGMRNSVDGRQGLRPATMRCALLTCMPVALIAAAAVLLMCADAGKTRVWRVASDAYKASDWEHCQHAAAS